MILNKKDFMNALKFCIVTAAKKDIRYYFSAVQIEVNADHLLMVTTDGHRISTVRLDVPGIEDGTNLLIDRSSIDDAIKMIGNVKDDDAIIKLTVTESGVVELSCEGLVLQLKVVDGQYPDWRRITRNDYTKQLNNVGFTCAYLADIGKAFKHVTQGKEVLAQMTFSEYNKPIKITTGSMKGLISCGQLTEATMYLAPLRVPNNKD